MGEKEKNGFVVLRSLKHGRITLYEVESDMNFHKLVFIFSIFLFFSHNSFAHFQSFDSFVCVAAKCMGYTAGGIFKKNSKGDDAAYLLKVGLPELPIKPDRVALSNSQVIKEVIGSKVFGKFLNTVPQTDLVVDHLTGRLLVMSKMIPGLRVAQNYGCQFSTQFDNQPEECQGFLRWVDQGKNAVASLVLSALMGDWDWDNPGNLGFADEDINKFYRIDFGKVFQYDNENEILKNTIVRPKLFSNFMTLELLTALSKKFGTKNLNLPNIRSWHIQTIYA